MTETKWAIWKHDCVKDGQGPDQPCDPPCEDPWQADAPNGEPGGTFPTRSEALDWISRH